MELRPALHRLSGAGASVVLMLAAVCLFAFPSAGFSWTSVGPWGGVIHDLDASAGGDTLFAGTANGLYMRNITSGAETWTSFESTSGFRVLQVLPDPDGDTVYAIARGTDEPFGFEETVWSGSLYELDLTSDTFQRILGGDNSATAGTVETLSVSSMALCGASGDLIATTENDIFFDGSEPQEVGYVYRRPYGSSSFLDPVYPRITFYMPISAVAGQAGSDTIFIVRSKGNYHEILRDGSCGSSPGYPGAAWPFELDVNGYRNLTGDNGAPTAVELMPGGEVFLGTETGKKLFRRDVGGTWAALGSGMAPYPVAALGRDSLGRPVAVLRKYNWNVDNGVNIKPGVWYLDVATWINAAPYATVSSRIRKWMEVNGTEWLAYDQAGIWSINKSGSLVESDAGIAAVNLDGIVIDPRHRGRTLAFGRSGVYESVNGAWSRLLMSGIGSLKNTDDAAEDVRQSIRDVGYISAAVSPDSEDTIWVGSEAIAGLLRGTRVGAGPAGYLFDQVYWGTSSRTNITDILVDPFNPDIVWFTNLHGDEGILRSTDGGTGFLSMTAHLFPDTDYSANCLVSDLDEPQFRTILAGMKTGSSQAPGILVKGGSQPFQRTSLFMNQEVGGIAFNPMDVNKALTGPENILTNMAIANNGSWEIDPSVGDPSATLPTCAVFRSLEIPGGLDGDNRPDAFAVLNRNGAVFARLFHSEAQTDGGTPGEVWEQVSGAFDIYTPTSVTVDPKDGDLLWVTTQNGSVFTHHSGRFTDYLGPDWPLNLAGELVVLGANASTLDLFWRAPGDDSEMPGWADRYELYYRADGLAISSTTDFNGAYMVDLPSPHISRREENYSLDISSHAGSEYFSLALVAYDEKNNTSGLLTGEVDLAQALSNTPPTALDDSTSLEEDTRNFTVPLLSNDSDADGDTISVISVGGSEHGVSYIDDQGTVRYTPHNNYFGPDTFGYTIVDGKGGSDSATAYLTITSVNDPPVARDDHVTFFEGAIIPIFYMDNDSDVEGTVTCVSHSDPMYGTVTEDHFSSYSPSVFNYTPDEGANWYGTDTFTYTIKDVDGAQDTATVYITVVSRNDAPVSLQDYVLVAEGGMATALTSGASSVLDNDNDPVEGNTLTALVVTGPVYGALILNSDGTFQYAHNGSEAVSDSFTYKARDEDGFGEVAYSSPASVTITIEPLNDAPVAGDDSVFVLASTTNKLITLLDNDSDSDGTLSILYAGPSLHGSVILSTDGYVRYTSPLSSTGYTSDSFTYTVSDGELSDTATVTVNIIDSASAVAIDDAYSIDEDQQSVFDVTRNDARLAEGDHLEVISVTPGNHGTAVADTTADTVTYTPDPAYTGEDTFTYQMTDGYTGSDWGTVTVNVSRVNDPPVAGDHDTTVFTGSPLTFPIPVTDEDSEDLLVSLLSSVLWYSAAAQEKGNTWQLSYESAFGVMGTDVIEYRATDDKGESDTGTLRIWSYNTGKGPVEVTPAALLTSGEPDLALDGSVKLSDATVAFSYVSTIGNTRCNTGTLDHPAPPGYQAGGVAWYYDLSTSAVYTGPLSVIIDLKRVQSSFVNPEQIKIFKYSTVSGQWEPLGYTEVHMMDLEAVGLTDSLGKFALFEPETASSGGGDGGGGGCFIATAAYGSAMEPEVDLLRGYRNSYLVHRWWGRVLLKAYYTLSPAPAAFIAERPLLRQGARLVLSPIIATVKTDEPGCAPAVIGFLLVGIPLAGAGLTVLGMAGILRRRWEAAFKVQRSKANG
ncbi:MAG: Ig-like domain-containing protein [bacterium]|nr:Ig-like domain-containing protein [bacterium]